MQRTATFLPALFAALVAQALPSSAFDLPLTARGNEPGWVITLNPEGAALSLQSGTRQDWPLPAPVVDGDDHTYPLAAEVSLRLSAAICRDSMTGMPYPLVAELTHPEGTMPGCGGDPASLLAGDWRLQSMAGHNPPEPSDISLSVSNGQISGHSGCNRYFGALALSGEGMSLGPLGVTRMACPPPQMLTEQAVLDMLSRVTRFDLSDEGALILLAGDDPVATFGR